MPKQDWEENTVRRIFEAQGLWPWGDREFVSILDVACGLSLKSKFLPARIRVGVDIHEEYFKHIEADVPYVTLKLDVRELGRVFQPQSFDLVLALDIIEHLEKAEALALIADCERIARDAVILETPLGYVPQNIDIQGHGGDVWQTHRSGWEAEELEGLGYSVVRRPYRMADVKRHTEVDVAPDITILDAIKFSTPH